VTPISSSDPRRVQPGEGGSLVSILTPPGRGALAVVGVAGPGSARVVDAMFAPRAGRPIAARSDGAIAFGRWGGSGGEEVVVVRRAGERIEVHCHGGLAAAAAIVAGLVTRGGREITWREWLATIDRDGGTIAVEARAALAVVGGPRAAQILCRQLGGALDAELARIMRLTAAGDAAAARAAAERLLRAARVGLRLTRPWRVVVAGRVNAGKSSLVNALAGHARALVSPEPGTTRDVLETRIVLGGWEVDLVDTAGDRDGERPAGAVEAAGIARAATAAGAADLVLRVVPDDAAGDLPHPRPRELLVLSKCDRGPHGSGFPPDAVRTSAATGAGIGELAGRIVAALVPEEVADPDLLAGPVPFTAGQVAAVRAVCGA
jgi:tRNA modification GTPase